MTRSRPRSRTCAASGRLAILEYARKHDFRIDDFIEATASGQASEKRRRLDELTSILQRGDRVEVMGHRLCGEAEGSTTECLLDGLEVLRGGSPRADERIDFSRKRGYERCAPITLTAWLAVARARR